MSDVVFIYPIIKTDQIGRSLETLHKFTDRSKFKVIVVDQSIEGINPELYKYIDMWIRMRNEGFSKASNEGIIHALKWQTPYISIVNDDTEMMFSGWFEDAIKEFDTDPHILAVSPESPRVAMWGYGLEHGTHLDIISYKDEFSQKDIEYLKQGDYNKEEIQSRHPYQIPKSFPFTKRGVIDGIAMWMPIFKREAFIELGLFDERFVCGGMEDYDMLARAYSCAYPIPRDVCDPRFHRRMVSTMKSWVWHWWGQSKDHKEKLDPRLFEGKEPWADADYLWPPEINEGHHMDVWGHYTNKDGIKKPLKRIQEVKIY